MRTVITFQPESQPQKTSKVDGEILNQNTLIIVIVVICAVLLMAFIVIAIVSIHTGAALGRVWGTFNLA